MASENHLPQWLESKKVIAVKHNFSPHSCITWNNQHVPSRNKSRYLKERIDKGVIFILGVLTDRGNFYGCEDFVGINISQKVYIYKKDITKLLFLVKSALLYDPLSGETPKLSDRMCNNHHIRKTLISDQSYFPKSILLWKLKFGQIQINSHEDITSILPL